MLKEIETHREQITELCRRYGVKRLELFGSAARVKAFLSVGACLHANSLCHNVRITTRVEAKTP